MLKVYATAREEIARNLRLKSGGLPLFLGDVDAGSKARLLAIGGGFVNDATFGGFV